MDPESTQLQQAQLAAILGPDPSPFETLVSDLMSSSNEQRSHAEFIFNLCKQADPDSLSLKLAHILQYSPHAGARAMSASLLRKQLTRDDSNLWPRLSSATQSSLKSILLARVQREDAKTISKKLCDTVSELASGILPENGWPELLPFVFQCVSSDSPKLQESAFLIFAQLSQYIGETLIPHIERLHCLFLQCLDSSSSSDVKIAALSAAINFIQCLSSPSDRDLFRDLLRPMMNTLAEALNSGQEATAQEALELLIELARTEPSFLSRRLVYVVGAMLMIAEAESLEERTRHLAIEFVITLSEAREQAPGMMRKLPQFISGLFAILMKMLLEDIEDDPAWHSAESEDEDAGETSNYSVGQEYLNRLAISMGGNTILRVALEQLTAPLVAPEWQKHHAALIALAQISEGCSEVMIINLEQVVTMVLDSLQDPHPRVRWAAINAIGQLSTNLGPDLQVQYHHLVLPPLAFAMEDFQNPRVQVHAASAVLKFSENCPPDILTPYLEGILKKLLDLLQVQQDPHPRVRWAAINAIVQLSTNLGGDLRVQYHQRVLPLLAFAMDDFQNPRIQLLQANAASAVHKFSENCPRDILWPYLEGILKKLLDLLQVQQDSHLRGAAINAIGQLSTDLGPYLQVQYHQRVLPALAVAMDDFQNPRVQAHAASAVLKFSEKCPRDILTPYLEEILKKLVDLLQKGEPMVQEGVLTALATLPPYQVPHDWIMRRLKDILVNATDELISELRFIFKLRIFRF